MNNLSEITQLLKESVDYKFHRSTFRGGLIATGIAFAFMGLPSFMLWSLQPQATITLCVLSFLMGAPAWAYGLWKMHNVCKNSEQYELYDATLKNPHPAWRFIRFEIYLDDGSVLDSNGVFANSSLSYGSFDEWNNKKVLVALDKNNERIIVLKIK